MPHINPYTVIIRLAVLIFTGLSALLIARYSAERFNTNAKKTSFCMVGIALLNGIFIFIFFGCGAVAVKGIILCLIFLLASFEDVKVRECDDFLHVMVLIAGFIGTKQSDIPGMAISAITVFAVMLGTVIVTKEKLGGADIKMATACSFALGIKRGFVGLVIGLILAVTVNLFNGKSKNKGFPLIPYLAVGYMTAYFI